MIRCKIRCKLGRAGTVIKKPTKAEVAWAEDNPTCCVIIDVIPRPVGRPPLDRPKPIENIGGDK